MKKLIKDDEKSASLTTKGNNLENKSEMWVRSNSITIKQKADMAFTDILKKIEGSDDLKDMESKVHKIRRTQTGELILVIKKSASNCWIWDTNYQNIRSGSGGQTSNGSD